MQPQGEWEDSGWLRVVVEGTRPGGEPIVDIRDAELRLQQRARANQYTELYAGLYVVSAALPDGRRPTRAVNVVAGDRRDVVLGALSPPVQDTYGYFAMHAPPRLLTRLGSFRPARFYRARFRQPVLYTRVVPAPGAHSPSGAARAPLVMGGSEVDDTTYLELAVEPPPAISVAQFALGNEVPTNVVLPLHSDAHNAHAELQVIFDRHGAAGPVAIPTGSPEIELVASYMRTGQVEAAAEVVDQATYLMWSKELNPIGAALGGYALLRVGATSRLYNWPTNLANWFRWLPDGPVIAGELAAREGDDARAMQWFLEALDRGYPVFSDGLSMLASRLRPYLYCERAPAAILEREEEVRRLIRMVPFVDFNQLTVTFKGLDIGDPAGSQDPLSRRAARAWTALRRS